MEANPDLQQPGDPRARPRHAPVDAFLAHARSTRDEPGAAHGWTASRFGLRVRGDTNLLLGIAIALPVLAMEAISTSPLRTFGLLAPLMFVATQFALTALRNPPAWLPTARLAFCLAFIGLANLWIDPTGTWPLSALAIPVVALAAANGGRGGVGIVVLGMLMMLVPLLRTELDVVARQSVFAREMAAIVLAYGTRRVVDDLERSSHRLRRANTRSRHRARQLAAVETVGRLLAREGQTETSLEAVMAVLETTFGFRYPSVYVWDGQALQLGAQRNYRYPIQTVNPDEGIIGRIVRTHEAVFLPDVRTDPEFLSADPEVVSEIGIPLLSDGLLLGILNVESNAGHRLDLDDFALMQIVGDRLAAALALGHERQKLTERAALLGRLTAFSLTLNASLDPSTIDDEVATGAATVVPADSVLLVNRDDATGLYVINALAGGDPSILGRVLEPGEGISGRAMVTKAVAVDDRMARAQFPKSARDVDLPDVLAGMAAPMLIGDEVVGVVTWLRSDLAQPFTEQEQEVGALLAGKVALALANARLHQQTADAAIRDPLTGLHNRRHFDATLEREDAQRRRIAAERRALRSTILFDLDHFGKVNKRFGHQVGDRVLRLFADTLRARARSSDLVARYGGEEFVVILDNATREAAAEIADDVREAFGKLTVRTASGYQLTTTVSAGVATLEAWEVEGSLLVERADVALAMAKAAGRDQVVAA
ncbi:MAG TPA: diguanylate cyclase [Candidatus Limnocylindrales bacterium]|nr:diguanylate cyclase [Candidatus Limnocylindrales bacterium]